MPDPNALDWSALDRLRARFLARDAASTGPYWENPDDLAAYDATYGERIGWKWDALLKELRLRRWSPPTGAMLVDFGCGSGTAGRRVLAAFNADHFAAYLPIDRSPLAANYAGERARAAYKGLHIAATRKPPYVLVVSHVLNELGPADHDQLLTLASAAEAVLWVEPGTRADGRALAEVRDRLRASGHRIVAPCTHRENCPLFRPEHARDWCHFFAEPPPGVQNDSGWVRFAQRAGLDLRSQAYSCLVLDRDPAAGTDAAGAARILGRPEVFKPYARLLACEPDGLHTLELPRRTAPAAVRRLDKRPPTGPYRLRHDGRRISEAIPLTEEPTSD